MTSMVWIVHGAWHGATDFTHQSIEDLETLTEAGDRPGHSILPFEICSYAPLVDGLMSTPAVIGLIYGRLFVRQWPTVTD